MQAAQMPKAVRKTSFATQDFVMTVQQPMGGWRGAADQKRWRLCNTLVLRADLVGAAFRACLLNSILSAIQRLQTRQARSAAIEAHALERQELGFGPRSAGRREAPKLLARR